MSKTLWPVEITARTFSIILFFASTRCKQIFPLEPIVENRARIVTKVVHALSWRKVYHTKPHGGLNLTSSCIAPDEGVYEHLQAIHILFADVLITHVAEAAQKLKSRLEGLLLQVALIELILLAENVDE